MPIPTRHHATVGPTKNSKTCTEGGCLRPQPPPVTALPAGAASGPSSARTPRVIRTQRANKRGERTLHQPLAHALIIERAWSLCRPVPPMRRGCRPRRSSDAELGPAHDTHDLCTHSRTTRHAKTPKVDEGGDLADVERALGLRASDAASLSPTALGWAVQAGGERHDESAGKSKKVTTCGGPCASISNGAGTLTKIE